MLLTLLKALKTHDLNVLVQNLSMSAMDIDLLLWHAQENGEVEVDRQKGRIKALKDLEAPYYDLELVNKIRDVIKFYDQQEANVTDGRIRSIASDHAQNPQAQWAYPQHEVLCALYVIENGLIPEPQDEVVKVYEISVPEIKGKRPYNKFKFFTFLDHQEFGQVAVEEFKKQFEDKPKKK